MFIFTKSLRFLFAANDRTLENLIQLIEFLDIDGSFQGSELCSGVFETELTELVATFGLEQYLDLALVTEITEFAFHTLRLHL